MADVAEQGGRGPGAARPAVRSAPVRRRNLLAASLTELSRLEVGQGQQGLEDMLTCVATLAVQAIPGAQGAGITVLQDNLPDTIVSSADFVREVDLIQYRLGEGPCIAAVNERRTVRVGSLSQASNYPRFGPLAAGLGVNSSLSLPLITTGGVLGSLNVYARVRNAYSATSADVGELFAKPAATSVANAQTFAEAQRLAVHLRSAVSRHELINRAVGILMERAGCRADEALAALDELRRAADEGLVSAAQRVVDGAIRPALALAEAD
jgi:GAF domain-containing protein